MNISSKIVSGIDRSKQHNSGFGKHRSCPKSQLIFVSILNTKEITYLFNIEFYCKGIRLCMTSYEGI